MTNQRDPKQEATEPSFREHVEHLRMRELWRLPVSNVRPELSPETLERAQQIEKQYDSPAARLRVDQRVALLGVVMAELHDVPFEQKASILGVSARQLERMIHGDAPIPEKNANRWEVLAEILINLHRVLRPEATNRWLNTPIPDLGTRTPLEVIRRNDAGAVLEVTRSYLDTSFS
jgi:uncharacterized protein (DUF2384 family)